METLVGLMLDFAKSASLDNKLKLKAAIPRRERRHWDLSPPPGFFDEELSDCPADFAGDSIFYAACAMLSDQVDGCDDRLAFDAATECLARLLVERDAQYSDDKDYRYLAGEHLRNRMIDTLGEIAA